MSYRSSFASLKVNMESRPSAVRQYYVAVGTLDAKLTTLVELLQALRADRRLALAVCCSSRDAVDSVAKALAACKCFNLALLHSDLAPHDIEQQVLQLKRRLQAAQQPSQQHLSEEHPLQEQPAAARQPMGGDQAEQQEQRQQQFAPAQLQQQGSAADAGHSTDGLQLPAGAAAGSFQAVSDSRCLVLVTSDACLKGISKELTPIGLPLLIQVDLPASKEILQRRLATVFGSSKERGRRAKQQVVIDFVVAGEVAAFRARERLSSAPVLEMPVHVPDIFC